MFPGHAKCGVALRDSSVLIHVFVGDKMIEHLGVSGVGA
jgi:hypothetical protein